MRAKFIASTLVGFLVTLSPTAMAEQSYGLEELKQTIQTNKVTTIESLIPLLPMDLRSNFTLVHKSKSIQDASLMNPRVILFGQTGKLILTFNGDPSQRGYNALEIMSFDEIKKKYDLHEMTFDGSSRPTLSEANPKKCTMCHNSTPRPIWEEYRTWEGVFGRDDDDLGASAQTYKTRGLEDAADDQSLTDFKTFRETQAQHPRYKSLPWQTENFCFPYHCDFQVKSLKNSPNTKLGMLLSLNNAMAIAQRVSKSPNFESFKYSLARGLLCETPDAKMKKIISHMMPSASIPRDERWIGSFEQWAKDVTTHNAILNLFGEPYGATANGLRLDTVGDTNIRKFNSPLQNGIDTAEDTAVGPHSIRGALSMQGFADSKRMTVSQILRFISKKDAHLANLVREAIAKDSKNFNNYDDPSISYEADEAFLNYFVSNYGYLKTTATICPELVTKSEQELKKPAPKTGGKLTAEDRPKNWTAGWEILAKSKCIACHDTQQSDRAPKIPFGDPFKFAAYVHDQKKSGAADPIKVVQEYLMKEPKKDGEGMEEANARLARMPLAGAVLSLKEQKAVIDYLKWVSEAYKK